MAGFYPPLLGFRQFASDACDGIWVEAWIGDSFWPPTVCGNSLRNPYNFSVPRSPGEKADMTLKVEYDAEANAAYIRFSSEPVQDSEEVSQGIVLDYDAEGRIVGMEVLGAREHLPPAVLTKAA
ncbi:DUF2283 domain-containing protein [Mesorhizobium sp. KR2-14]